MCVPAQEYLGRHTQSLQVGRCGSDYLPGVTPRDDVIGCTSPWGAAVGLERSEGV